MSSTGQLLRQVKTEKLVAGVALLLLTAFYSPVSLLTLAPVYGAAPSHIFHGYGVAVVAAAGWFLKDLVNQLSARRAVYLIPVFAFWLPTIQYFLLQQSSAFGNPIGPLITEIFTFYPLVFVSVACAGKLVQAGLNLRQHGDLMAEHIPLLGSYVVYSAAESFAKTVISKCLGSTFLLTRAGLQLLLAILYSAAIPSKWLVLAIPSIIFSFTSNVHMPLGRTTAALNSAILDEGYQLLARQDSSTGYISVLENLEDGFRVMRCDHSLLGGQWTKMPRNYHPEVKDPIYAVFAMLEAIRLIETDQGEARMDANSKALVIGLGVGTTPSALITHGIETTIVEIDPVVHKFAKEYFYLPSNHIAAIEDATVFVQRAQESANPAQYDYIVHDVFTGGAEPVELFTIEFIKGLYDLLKNDGVIAINYAGDISLYPTALAVRTIMAVFPSCRIFREDSAEEAQFDFTNMVIFCKKSNDTPLRFRDAVKADFLGSRSRENYLVPKHEVDPAMFQSIQKGGRRVLVAKETGRLHKFQDRSANGHWEIMRTVVPKAIWENW
ncbi:spermidine synthase [Aspergillus clavatus NRRL 1]|uniref:Spermine/spermidine synthase, putative n=1 Tax=Aspergillus clavatus (strain ATCC 1007 / CBS 513.65 / DSM 816 / NCTC 3887 / NRRL 1 / QM 1276 / 107) TaxID=344612 RepID=A1CAK7_ASPCL|nr:spermine/spermidine synthase, putative [Aspergillus clavatus NRRL 1]EAW12775.1 spermine/spermidine synthase, putative [Aspergillus clavatus NRRL 1]